MAEVSNGHGNFNANTEVSTLTKDQETPPPTPPPKDSVPPSPGPGGINAYFDAPRHSRANSIYSLSRASFTHQLNQLTSLQLPDANSLSSTVAAIPTAAAAARALNNAASQIQLWIQKADEVLSGLDADDDVEWASAGGRDGVDDVEQAIKKFAVLVKVYITAMEDLQKRPDIRDVYKVELKVNVEKLDSILASWEHVQGQLSNVKKQVNLALEWGEIWNTVCGEIGQEIESLKDFVFEMQEQRHRAKPDEDAVIDSNVQLDIQELQTIVEENPVNSRVSSKPQNRMSLLPALSNAADKQSPRGSTAEKPADAKLIELFARLQPLRASIEFLPLKLKNYRGRAEDVFPSACDELDDRQDQLVKKYEELEEDSNRLREELAEDHWVDAFRSADRQVRKMSKSMEYGIAKLQEALESVEPGSAASNPVLLNKKIHDYEAKKAYYAPNLQKVINIINTGVRDRKTVNGEVLRIQQDARGLWDRLQSQMKEVDSALELLSAHTFSQMRDSVSSIVSNDLSMVESAADTPSSSPASSIYNAPIRKKGYPATPNGNSGSRASSIRSVSGNRATASTGGKARTSSSSTFSNRLSSNNPMARLASASPSPGARPSSNTPTPNRRNAAPPPSNRPRWNSSPVVDYNSFGHYKPITTSNVHTRTINGKPLVSKPSIYSYRTPSRAASTSHLVQTQSSPLARDSPSTPQSSLGARAAARAVSSMGHHPRTYNTSPSVTRTPPSISGSANKGNDSEGRPRSRLYKPTTPQLPTRLTLGGSASSSDTRRASLLPIPSSHLVHTLGHDQIACTGDGENSPTFKATLARRPATAMQDGRRSSLLPVRKE